MTITERTLYIEKIRALPKLITSVVAGLSDTQLDTPYRQGGWTPRQVVHHLADSHMNAFIRMKLALTEAKPAFKTYEQDEWARLADATKLPAAVSLAILGGLHERWTTLLEALREEEWKRIGLHPDSGEMSIEALLKMYALHGENHVAQITGLRTSRGW